MITQITANGQVFERAGGISIPSFELFADKGPNDPIPETIIRVFVEIEGGELKKGERVTIQTTDFLLKQPEQFKMEYYDPEEEKWTDHAWLGHHNDRRVRVVMELAEVKNLDDFVYKVTFPIGDNDYSTVDQDGAKS